MQENYVSLDPAHAESMTSQARQRLWWQRVKEQHGGEAGSTLALQFTLTGGLLAYASLKTNNGFRMTPFAPSKLP